MAGPPILRMRRSGWRPGVVFFGVFVFPMLGWAFYNSWDVPLSAPAQAALEAKPDAVPEPENLFLAMIAFPISGEEPAHERGTAALAAMAKAAPIQGEPSRTYADVMGRQQAYFDTSALKLCSPGNREGAYACLRDSRAQRAAFGPLVQQLTPLLRRYRELEGYPRYADPRPFAVDVQPDDSAFRVALVNLSIIALAMQEGSVDAGTVALAQSAALWRRVLAARDVTLIDKMIASRAYAAHLLFASELIREQPPFQGPALDALQALMRPLSDAERSLAGALVGEFRIQAAMWSQVTDPSSPIVRADFPDTSTWWYRLMTKKNDSINRSWNDIESLLKLEQAGCVAVRDRAAASALRAEDPGTGLAWYEWFYNPIGRVLHGTVSARESLVEYLGRQCNLAALQGMVGLQLEIKQSGQSADALAGQFTDPNSGKPYRFNAQAQTLAFEFIGTRKEFVTPLPLAASAP